MYVRSIDHTTPASVVGSSSLESFDPPPAVTWLTSVAHSNEWIGFPCVSPPASWVFVGLIAASTVDQNDINLIACQAFLIASLAVLSLGPRFSVAR